MFAQPGPASEESGSSSDFESASSDLEEPGAAAGEDSSTGESLGSDLDDDEVAAMVNQLIPRDHLVCQFVDKTVKKSQAKGKMLTLELALAHFEIDGVPRVVPKGTITCRMNG
jgi:hypothetical protein